MDFNKLFFDSKKWDNLILLGIREGFIRRIEGEKRDSNYLFETYGNKRVNGKSDILRNIALFDKIECLDASFDLTNLINEGLFENDISVLDSFEELHPNNTINEKSENTELLKLVSFQATEILLKSKRQVINHFRNVNQIDIPNNYPYRELSYSFDEAIKYYTNYEQFQFDKAEPYFEEDLDWLYRSIFVGIFKSYQEKSIYSPGLNIDRVTDHLNPTKLIDDVYYTVETKLSDEITYLPYPQTLKEAITIRNKREIRRFREILSFWIRSINDGDYQLEEIIRKDIQKANKELTRLDYVREYTNSPMNFWLNSIGGHIPVFSNILTVTNMFFGLYEKYTLKKNNWIMLTSK